MAQSRDSLMKIWVLTLIICGTLTTVATAAPGDIHPLTTAGGFGANTGSRAVNASGQVVGTIDNFPNRAFRFDGVPGNGGVLRDLGGFHGGADSSSDAFGISDDGRVVGWARTTTGPHHAFLYVGTPGAGGVMHDLGTLGGSSSLAYAVNTSGMITGYAYNTSGRPRAFLYTGTPGNGGAMVNLGTLGGSDSVGTAINESGQMTGHAYASDGRGHAFIYTGTPGAGGAMKDLGTLGGTHSVGWGINESGQVAGWANVGGFDRAFRYTGTPGAGGEMVNLGTLGGTYSLAYSLNDAGIVVGAADTVAGSNHATLWKADAANSIIDLDAWLDGVNPTEGTKWTLTTAYGINSVGLITGDGVYFNGNAHVPRAFLLDASALIPEPGGVALLGLIGLSALRRPRRIRA